MHTVYKLIQKLRIHYTHCLVAFRGEGVVTKYHYLRDLGQFSLLKIGIIIFHGKLLGSSEVNAPLFIEGGRDHFCKCRWLHISFFPELIHVVLELQPLLPAQNSTNIRIIPEILNQSLLITVVIWS